MKLIHIFALGTALASTAAAQNAGPSPTAKPSPAPARRSAPLTLSTPKPATQTPPKTSASPTGAGSTAKPMAKPMTPGNSTAPAKSMSTAPMSTAPGMPAKPSAAGSGQQAPGVKMKPQPQPPLRVQGPPGAHGSGNQGSGIQAPAAKNKPAASGMTAAAPKKTPQLTTQEPAKPAGAQPDSPAKSKTITAAGRRDPFVSPIRAVSAAAATGPAEPRCFTGIRCLSIPELVVQGTVKDWNGKMTALVMNASRRTYMLHENDQVFNGVVEKITSDSVIFREYAKDNLGKQTAHEIVKKVGPTT